MIRTLAAAAVCCLATSASAGDLPPLEANTIATVSQSIYLTHAPDDSRLFVCTRSGQIRVLQQDGTLIGTFLNITGSVSTTFEGGLLGLAFHPDYANNGYFYVHYTRAGLVTVVSRFQVTGDPNVANAGSEMKLFEVTQPADNHNGGWIDFSPNDGYLYIALGDGGFSGSGQARAQDTTGQFLGKMLRIDVDGDDFPGDPLRNYAIPPSNPFVGVTGDDEIWAYGLRNPFRCSFDKATGDLWIGDVGEGSWEEIDFQPASSTGGENYAWGCMEGNACLGNQCTCNSPSLSDPVKVYNHAAGISVTGGSVYRGPVAALNGTYFYADYGSGRIWSMKYDGVTESEFVDRTSEMGSQQGVVAFGYDVDGNVYIVTLSGAIRKIGYNVFGDVDGDLVVGFNDLLIVLASWGPCSGGCPADTNNDGNVDFIDLVNVLSSWTI